MSRLVFGRHLSRGQALGALSWLGSETSRPELLGDAFGPRRARWWRWWPLAVGVGVLVIGVARALRGGV